jgi:hypothetical protein
MKHDTISEVKRDEPQHDVIAYTAGGHLVWVPRAEIAKNEDIVGKSIVIENQAEHPHHNIGHLTGPLM